MSERVHSSARDDLALMAVRAKVKLREGRVFDGYLGQYLDVRCSFKHLGHRLECHANDGFLRIQVKGLPTLLAFSVGRPLMSFFKPGRLRRTIGKSLLPVFGRRQGEWAAASPTRWFRTRRNKQAIEALGLRDGESLLLWGGDLALYVRTKGDMENWHLLDRLCEVANALPPPEPSRARDDLATIAAGVKTKLQRIACFNANVPGPFDSECSFRYQGYRVKWSTNGEILCLELLGISISLAFAVGQPDRICLFDRPMRLTIGRSRLRIFKDRFSQSPEQWLSSRPNGAAIEELSLGHGESLHVYRNSLVVYYRPRGYEGNWRLLEKLYELAKLLPEEKIELAEGEELVDGLEFSPSRLPDAFQHLAPLIRKWAIGDDVKRVEKEERASKKQLKMLIDAVWPQLAAIDAYLNSVENETPYPNEAILLGWLAECAAEVKVQMDGT